MSTWVLIASGPSLHQDDIDIVDGYQKAGMCKVAVTCRTWERVPWADLLYAADARWWDNFNPGDKFNGEKWTLSSTAARRYGIQAAQGVAAWGKKSPQVFTGGLSGIQLVNLIAYRASRIILLGYDCQHTDGRRHHHADYPDMVNGTHFTNVPNLRDQVRHFDHVAQYCPVPIINATRETALTQFPRCTIAEALA